MPIFHAAAWFDPPVQHRRRASTKDPRAETVSAETPEAAARKWLWRLSPEERAATARVVVWAPERDCCMPDYKGPAISYRREGTQLIEIERKPWPPPARRRR